MGYKVAVVGATGNVGREMLNILAERQFPVDEITVLASRRSMGTDVSFGDKTLKTKDLEQFDFTGWDIAFFAIGSDATKIHAPRAAKAGCVVIDNSSLYRYDSDVPLVVPEVNPDAIKLATKKNIVANPNCSTAPGSSGLSYRRISPSPVPGKRAWTSCGTRPSRSTIRSTTSPPANSPSRSPST